MSFWVCAHCSIVIEVLLWADINWFTLYWKMSLLLAFTMLLHTEFCLHFR